MTEVQLIPLKSSDRESYQKLPGKFNRIYISEDKKHLRVHIGDTVVYYKAEKDE